MGQREYTQYHTEVFSQPKSNACTLTLGLTGVTMQTQSIRKVHPNTVHPVHCAYSYYFTALCTNAYTVNIEELGISHYEK